MNRELKIEIQLIDGASHALEMADVSIDVVLYVQRRMRYRFCAGKTDLHGRLCVTFDGLESLRLFNQSFSIMDYNTKIQECDSRISFVVPSLNELQQRRTAMEKWFPEDVSKSGCLEESNNGKLLCEDIDVDVNDNVKKVSLICKLA